MSFLFFILVALIFYSYVGYGVCLWLLVGLKKLLNIKRVQDVFQENFPAVTLIIPAYNEKEIIDQKMENTFCLDYPTDKLKVVWITDGSDDGSEKYLRERYMSVMQKFSVEVLHQPERKGKSAAINRAMNFVSTDIVIFCDANTMLNEASIKNIVRHFNNPYVGCVAGEKRVLADGTTAGDGESFYWKYESWIKQLSSELNTCIGSVGELNAIRTHLFKPLPADTILDDFVLSMQIAHRGYKIEYEPDAYAEEAPSENEREEMKRKVRIATGAFQSMFRFPEWLNVFKHPVLSYQYFSHKITRWLIVPFGLPIVFILNIILFFKHPENTIYSVLLFLQLCFYSIVIIQYVTSLPAKLFRLPYYIWMMNVAMLKGFVKYILHQQSPAWEKVRRKELQR